MSEAKKQSRNPPASFFLPPCPSPKWLRLSPSCSAEANKFASALASCVDWRGEKRGEGRKKSAETIFFALRNFQISILNYFMYFCRYFSDAGQNRSVY
jgi:hypothetical protein